MLPGNSAPVIVVNQQTQREEGKKAQLANIRAAKAVADIIRTTLGPRSMLKMLLDPMGGIVLTNDGNAILREIDVKHPAAKSMIELSRTQDEEVGDGTTSVIILAGELMTVAEPYLLQKIHPINIVGGYFKALDIANAAAEAIAKEIDIEDKETMEQLVKSCVGTKFASRWGNLLVDLAVKAVKTVHIVSNGRHEVDIKRYAKIEKIPGGDLEECIVLDGVMFNKDVTHPKMRRLIENPRVILLDCPLEYKKGESMTNVEMTKEEDFTALLKQEEEEVQKFCEQIMKLNPDVVITEKGVSDLAQHFLLKQNISVIRRIRKTDNNRIARVCGARIVNRTDELQESDVGTRCHRFEIRKIADDYFTFMTECEQPTACSIILRGGSKDTLNELERNLQDAMNVARNIILDPKLVPGGGAVEMHVSRAITKHASTVEGVQQWPFAAVAQALEVIPRTLAQNCGCDVVRVVTELRAKHTEENQDAWYWGIDGNQGKLADMRELGIWEPLQVKKQVFKTAIESACMLLKIDDVVSGMSRKEKKPSASGPVPEDTEV
jgi:T-complex protein 1 subunit gamma